MAQDQEQQQPAQDNQPFGITLIAALTAVVPLAILLRTTATTITLLSALLGVVAGAGLFFQKRWGHRLTIAYYVLVTLGTLRLYGFGRTGIVGAILPLLMIGYLLQPRIRASYAPRQ